MIHPITVPSDYDLALGWIETHKDALSKFDWELDDGSIRCFMPDDEIGRYDDWDERYLYCCPMSATYPIGPYPAERVDRLAYRHDLDSAVAQLIVEAADRPGALLRDELLAACGLAG